jgi:WD40 repeat protein
LRLCGSEGKLDEAEKMYQWALQGKEKAWGSDHTVLTLDTVNNLSFLYESQFKLDEVYQWALQRCDSTRRHCGDGKKVVSGSDDSTVRVWDIATGQADQTLTGHSDEVTSVEFSPDGKKVVSRCPGHTSTLSAVNNLPGLLGPSRDKYPPLKPEVVLPREVNISIILCLT